MNDDTISRQAAIDIERNATVDTNPSHFEAHQKFTQFMDDAEVSSFGRWQWANGFNTALTAVGIDLKKLPPAQPEQRWIPCGEGIPKKMGYYICTCHDGVCYRTSVLKWSIGWVLTGARSYWKVIAWMPLPEPWKGE